MLHIQVIDNTGSANFVLFDKAISEFLGKTAKQRLETLNKVKLGLLKQVDFKIPLHIA